jgi:hypothetical protein
LSIISNGIYPASKPTRSLPLLKIPSRVESLDSSTSAASADTEIQEIQEIQEIRISPKKLFIKTLFILEPPFIANS